MKYIAGLYIHLCLRIIFQWILISWNHLTVVISAAPINAETLQFHVTEEVPQGTVIAAGVSLGAIYLNAFQSVPRIINQKDLGVSSLSFRTRTAVDSKVPELQLVVTGRIDREDICPMTNTQSGSKFEPLGDYGTLDFHIDTSPDHGQISLSNSVRKQGSPRATDCGIPLRVATNGQGQQAIHQAIVYVQDINDNPPKWEHSSLVITYKDGDPLGTKQPIPLASDKDRDVNAIISYRLRDLDFNPNNDAYPMDSRGQMLNPLRPTEMFELHKETSSNSYMGPRLYLIAKHDIDREARPQGWDMVLIASNVHTSETLSSQLRIHVNITDVNDNAPQFSLAVYQPQLSNQKIGTVPETIPVGQTLLRIHATDADYGANAVVQYDFVSSPQIPLIRHFFELTPDGELRVRQPLEVDKKQISANTHPSPHLPTGLITFDVQAVDGAEPAYARTGQATVKLKIEDEDDEAPEIRVHPVRPWMPERGDKKQEGAIPKTVAELAVEENEEVGKLIGLIEANDPDNQGREIVRCRLVGKNAKLFHMTQQDMLGQENRLHTAEPFDREKQTRLIVTVECRDVGDHVTTVRIGVNILDVNDHGPVFTEQTYRFSVYEDDGELQANVRVGTKQSVNRTWLTDTGKAFVRATDADQGNNSRLNYRLNDDQQFSDNLFGVNEATGELFAFGPLDREQMVAYEFKVYAIDQGEPQLTGSCSVRVNVVDVNDNPPQFAAKIATAGGYSFNVLENKLPGTRIGQVEAYDLDVLPASYASPGMVETEDSSQTRGVGQDQLHFGLENEPDASSFWIDPKSGVLITRAMLDREKQASYTIHVTVRDGPLKLQVTRSNRPSERVHQVSIAVTITVEDENDNDPVFIRPNATNHMVLLDPAAIPGQSLLQLHAEDPDVGMNGLITYTIRGGNSGDLFNVDARTGLLYLENQIPHKTIAEAANAASKSGKNNASPNNAGGNGLRSTDTEGSTNSDNSVSTHPTYLLALEACDQGEPKRCTNFPNLQIQLRLMGDRYLNPTNGMSLVPEGLSSSQLLMAHSANRNDWTDRGSNSNDFTLGQLSLAEIIIVSLTVFFSVQIVAILITIYMFRRRRILRQARQKAPMVIKSSGTEAGNTVELLSSSHHQGRGHSNKQQVPFTNKLYQNQDHVQTWNVLQRPEDPNELQSVARSNCPGRVGSTEAPVRFTESFAYMTDNHGQSYALSGMGSEYGLINATFPPRTAIEGDYQALEAWTNHMDRHHPVPTSMLPDGVGADNRHYYTHHPQQQQQQQKRESGKLRHVPPHGASNMDDKLGVLDLLPSSVCHEPNDWSGRDYRSQMKETIDTSIPIDFSSGQNQPPNQGTPVKVYAGVPKSSFV